jgi:hypothetical protein
LIESLNGGPSSTQLGDWLAATLPNMYGSGDNDLAGKTNAEVADVYVELFRRKKREAVQAGLGGPAKLELQVLATALSVYVTNETLAGTVAADYGFVVTEHGLGISTYDVGDSGEAFGVADDTEMTVLEILLATDEMSSNGVLYDGDDDGDANDGTETLRRREAFRVYAGINSQGSISP